jgi:hypothetical protein
MPAGRHYCGDSVNVGDTVGGGTDGGSTVVGGFFAAQPAENTANAAASTVTTTRTVCMPLLVFLALIDAPFVCWTTPGIGDSRRDQMLSPSSGAASRF